jgi:hypothetical protein
MAWDKISGDLIWSVMVLVGSFVIATIRHRLERFWKWATGMFRKKVPADANAPVSAPAVKVSKLDSIGIWFLVLAIVLLAVWNRKLERDARLWEISIVSF